MNPIRFRFGIRDLFLAISAILVSLPSAQGSDADLIEIYRMVLAKDLPGLTRVLERVNQDVKEGRQPPLDLNQPVGTTFVEKKVSHYFVDPDHMGVGNYLVSTAISEAAFQGFHEGIPLLLRHGADPNILLRDALTIGDPKLFKIAINAGANLSGKVDPSEPIFYWPLSIQELADLRYILFRRSYRQISLYDHALKTIGDMPAEMRQEILKMVDPNLVFRSMVSAHEVTTAELKQMMDEHKIDFRGEVTDPLNPEKRLLPALHFATRQSTVHFLLDHGARTKERDWTFARLGFFADDASTVRRLLESGADPNYPTTALHHDVAFKVQSNLKRKFGLNWRKITNFRSPQYETIRSDYSEWLGAPPLLTAVCTSNLRAVLNLLEFGANPAVKCAAPVTTMDGLHDIRSWAAWALDVRGRSARNARPETKASALQEFENAKSILKIIQSCEKFGVPPNGSPQRALGRYRASEIASAVKPRTILGIPFGFNMTGPHIETAAIQAVEDLGHDAVREAFPKLGITQSGNLLRHEAESLLNPKSPLFLDERTKALIRAKVANHQTMTIREFPEGIQKQVRDLLLKKRMANLFRHMAVEYTKLVYADAHPSDPEGHKKHPRSVETEKDRFIGPSVYQGLRKKFGQVALEDPTPSEAVFSIGESKLEAAEPRSGFSLSSSSSSSSSSSGAYESKGAR